MPQDNQDRTSMPPLGDDAYRVLVPPALGLGLSSAAVNLCTQCAHSITGASTSLGFISFFSALVIGALFVSTLFVKRYAKRAVHLSMFVSVHIAGLCALALGASALFGSAPTGAPALALGVGVTVGSTMLEFYWLRKLRGISAQAAVVVVFSALALGETVTYALSFSGESVWYLAGAVFSFAQFAVVRASRALDVPSEAFPAVSESYFGTDENRFSNRSFLMVAVLGILLISIPIGMGRGFPYGDSIYMSMVPRLMILIFVWFVSVLWVGHGLKSRMRKLTTSIWVVMQVLLALGAVFFAIWPKTVSIGASFVMAASLVLTAFVWYMTIAFVSFGWRDPFYYAAAGWISVNVLTFFGMHIDALITRVMPQNAPVIISVMSFFVLASSQLVFTRLLAAPSERAETEFDRSRRAGDPITQEDVRRIPLMGVLAIAPQTEVPMVNQRPDVHIATSVMAMAQRFGLTGREVEVLTLYALGHTQARVSEELQLSTNTVHTHIKRIYDKTDLHSRQEILDYIAEYGG